MARASLASNPRIAGLCAAAFAAALLTVSCGPRETRSDAQKGQTLYALHCIACHNPDPSRDGALGPAVKGSSLELLDARIVRGEYPPGYTPKRPTRMMQKLPLQPDEIKALHAFLNGM